MVTTAVGPYAPVHRDLWDSIDHLAQAANEFTRSLENIRENWRMFIAELLDNGDPKNWRQKFWNKLAYTWVHGIDMAVELMFLQWARYRKNIGIHVLGLTSAIPHLNARKAKAAFKGIRQTFRDFGSDIVTQPYNIWFKWELSPLRTRWRRAYNADGTTPAPPPPPPPPPAPAAP